MMFAVLHPPMVGHSRVSSRKKPACDEKMYLAAVGGIR